MNKVIEQKHYPQIEIDDTEKDIVQYWQRGKEDVNVLQVERDKLHLLMPATPATSWEEVEKGCQSLKFPDAQANVSDYTNGHNTGIEKVLEYLSQHWPSSQPVSPTPMAETWEQVHAAWLQDQSLINHTPEDFLDYLKENYTPYPAPPSLHQVDRWIRVEDVKDAIINFAEWSGKKYVFACEIWHKMYGTEKIGSKELLEKFLKLYPLPAAPETDKK